MAKHCTCILTDGQQQASTSGISVAEMSIKPRNNLKNETRHKIITYHLIWAGFCQKNILPPRKKEKKRDRKKHYLLIFYVSIFINVFLDEVNLFQHIQFALKTFLLQRQKAVYNLNKVDRIEVILIENQWLPDEILPDITRRSVTARSEYPNIRIERLIFGYFDLLFSRAG